jgi:hypothetical protein
MCKLRTKNECLYLRREFRRENDELSESVEKRICFCFVLSFEERD